MDPNFTPKMEMFYVYIFPHDLFKEKISSKRNDKAGEDKVAVKGKKNDGRPIHGRYKLAV